MIEDEIYRSSSQYRLWSYTRESLSRIRQETNDLASQRVRVAFRRARSAQNGSSNAVDVETATAEIETLTVEEELRIVQWGCSKIVDMGEAMNPRIPSHVVVSSTFVGVRICGFCYDGLSDRVGGLCSLCCEASG